MLRIDLEVAEHEINVLNTLTNQPNTQPKGALNRDRKKFSLFFRAGIAHLSMKID